MDGQADRWHSRTPCCKQVLSRKWAEREGRRLDGDENQAGNGDVGNSSLCHQILTLFPSWGAQRGSPHLCSHSKMCEELRKPIGIKAVSSRVREHTLPYPKETPV